MSPLRIGQTLERYRILAEVGQGGMGVVYRALDTRLDREVAIKVLRSDRLSGQEWRDRLNRESRAASALNHPNIITIHDVSAEGDVEYIVMEYVAGQTLDRLIPPEGTPQRQALKWAISIADALSCAHNAGIIHRDLKPGNIMVSDTGAVKVLDFGLAKAAEREQTGADSTQTQRLSQSVTQAGIILGSAAYMSPEQAEGRRVDTRSDIFSFGSTLYEMLTGKAAFRHESRIATLGAIARSEPSPLPSQAGVQPSLEGLVLRCLRKRPEDRFQEMRDVKLALEDILAEWESGPLAIPGPAAPARRTWWWIPALAAVVLALGVWAFSISKEGPEPAPKMAPFTLDSGVSNDPTISPDGQWIAYASNQGGSRDIWLKQMLGGEPLRLTDHPADEHSPDFAPDGTEIVFYSGQDGGGIVTVPTLGGAVRRIADSPFWYPAPRYSPDGQWISFSRGANQIAIVPRTGGEMRVFSSGLRGTRQPIWMPDSKRLLVRARAPGADRLAPEWYVVSVDGGQPVATGAVEYFRSLGLTEADPGSWLGDRVLFTGGTTDRWHVWEIGLDPESLKVTSEPRQLTFGTGWEDHPAAAANGQIAMFSGTYNRDLYALPVDSSTHKVNGESIRLTDTLATDAWPSVSTDGKWMAYSTNRSGSFQVWLRELETGRERPITAGETEKWGPLISPSGRLVAFTERPEGQSTVFLVAARGGEPRRLTTDAQPIDWSPDEKYLLLLELGKPPVEQRVLVADVESGEIAPILEHPEYEVRGALFSPDGKWLAAPVFLQREVFHRYLAPFRNPQPIPQPEWRLIEESTSGRNSVVWAPDGRLYWFTRISGTLEVWSQPFSTATASFTAEPLLVYHPPVGPFEISTEKMAVAAGRIYFSRWAVLGNIWTVKLPAAR